MKLTPTTKLPALVVALLAALWFSACKTTPEPSTSMPPQPQSQDTAEKSQPPSSETRKPAQAGTSPETQSSQKTPPGAAEAAKQEPTEKPPQGQPAASPDAGETAPAPTVQSSDARRAEVPQTAESKLEKAREDLRVSEATEQKIAAKLEQLKKSGNASAEDIRDYETYHERVQDMVAENRERVDQMERAYRQHTSETKSSQQPGESAVPGSEERIPEEQTQDQVAELDRQLTASLSQFDAMLLKEMEAIENQSADKMRDLAQEAAEAAKRLKEKGVDLGTADSESSDEESQQGKTRDNKEAAEEDRSETEQGDVDDAVAASDRAKGEGPGPKNDRGSRYSKDDDDIVARQLREAAENETDPELKEKLWKEYEDYKRNTQ
jgi:hypothetical protein